jgi:hypothetical protein
VDDARVREIERIAGEGGYVSYRVRLQTPTGLRDVTFSGNIFVGPVAVTGGDTGGLWADEVIDQPRRFGEFYSPDWVWRFVATRQRAAV